ncbi:hypothetical protein Acy02nite_07520 [Actinoplanes cyaneus]|uniref:Uncharacterized protein n=1 Tax=Actinoplanes cyaneus TaxID=52696 RepID=A0A919M9C1_9ACTN|nr:hypothetical protein [Actinoplanes cyaneus]MCW2135766.1 hypothetical protein [Actinoplanes cyaneus]GID62871.1 hypothetical protein Acy02nite_07520 [Actinoplanes cyaneus]
MKNNVVPFLGLYVALSFSTVGATVALHFNTTLVISDAVWIRGAIVAASSLLTLYLGLRALGGDRRMLRRLRIVTAIMLAATVVVVAVPGLFPLWFTIDQLASGLLLLPVVIGVNQRPAVRL